MERIYDTFVHTIIMKLEARLCTELECIYKNITNKIVEKKRKLTNEDLIEFQKNYKKCTTRMLLFVKKLLALNIPRIVS